MALPGDEPQPVVGAMSSGTHTPVPPASPLSAIASPREGVPSVFRVPISKEAQERYSPEAIEDAFSVGRLTIADMRQMAIEELRWSLLNAKRPGLRSKIVKEILSRTDPVPKDGTSDKPISVNVAIVSSEADRQSLEAHRTAVRIVSREGDGA